MKKIEQIRNNIAMNRLIDGSVMFDESDLNYLLEQNKVLYETLEQTKLGLSKVLNHMSGGVVKPHIFKETKSVYYSVNEAIVFHKNESP